MSFKTASAILRGRWLIDKQWAHAQLPLIFSLMNGEAVDFGSRKAYHDDGDDEEGENKPSFSTSVYATKTVYNVRPYTKVEDLPHDSICMVSLSGPMIKRGDMCSYGMIDHANLINRLGDSERISGIILNIDSPGGQADGTAMLSDVIKKAGTNKPVIAIIDDGMAASAAMWIASAAHEIYVTQKTDQVGSIGVYTSIADWIKFYASKGLDVKEIYAPQSTDKNKIYYDALEGKEEGIKEELAVLADQFINTVSANRAGKIKGDDWKTGKMFYADQAKKIGLIDGIKNFDQVVSRMSTLISSKKKSNSNTMAFEKTLAAANATEFTVVDDGFVLTEENLNSVESVIAAAEKTTQQLSDATQTIATLKQTNSTQATKITELEAEIATFGKTASTTGSTVVAAAEEQIELVEDKALPRFDSPEHPANKAASRFLPKK